MLMLQEPIKLYCFESPTRLTDSFYNSMVAAYSVFSLNLTPKELLLLMTAEPELPAAAAPMTTFADESVFSQSSVMLVNIVNEAVNRILLLSRGDYTYQDQVFASSFLSKVGISETESFLSQTQGLAENNIAVHQMRLQYHENYDILQEANEKYQSSPSRKRSRSQNRDSAAARPVMPELYLDIYNRLQTVASTGIVNSFHRHSPVSVRGLSPGGIKASEQQRFANLISVTEFRRQIFPHNESSELRHVNRYELGGLLPAPTQESDVVFQAAAAAFLSLVDNTMQAYIESYISGERLETDIRRAIHHSAESSLIRFEAFHTQSAPVMRTFAVFEGEYSSLLKNEKELTEKLLFEIQRANPPAGKLSVQGGSADGTGSVSRSGEGLRHSRRSRKYLSMLEQIHREENTLLNAGLILQSSQASIPSGVDSVSTVPEDTRLWLLRRLMTESASPEEFDGARAAPQVLQEQVSTSQDARPAEAVSVTHTERDSFPGTEEIRKELERIEQQNESFHTRVVERQASRQPTEKKLLPDKKKTYRDSLRALENPGQVLSEILAGAEVAAQSDASSSPPGMEVILSQLDESTRQIVETVFLYEQNPERVIHDSLLRRESEASFNSAVVNVEREQSDIPGGIYATALEMVLSRADDSVKRIYSTILTHRDALTEAVSSGLLHNEDVERFYREIREAASAVAQSGTAARPVADAQYISAHSQDVYHSDKLLHRDVLTESVLESLTQRDDDIFSFHDHDIQRLQRDVAEILHAVHPETEGGISDALSRGVAPFTAYPSGVPATASGERRISPAPTVYRQTSPHLPEEQPERTTQSAKSPERKSTAGKAEREEVVRQTVQVHQPVKTPPMSDDEIARMINKTLSRQIGAISDQVYTRMERRLQLDRARRGRL